MKNLHSALDEHGALSRRTLIKGGAAAFGASFMRIGDALAQDTVAVRPAAHRLGMDSPETTALRTAVASLRQQGWWDFLATYHRQYCGRSQDVEIHWSWNFLPWHRLYLTIVERHLQAVIGDSSLGLPYWDWYARGTVPEIYFSDPLNDTTREIQPWEAMQLDDFGDAATENRLTDIPDFRRFGGGEPFASGQLEQGPHGGGHVFVGGNMAQFATAGLDPLFYAHHCNIDRLWEVWRGADPARPRSEPAAGSAWDARVFGFLDVDGSSLTHRASETVSTTDLGYRYDDVRPKFRAFAEMAQVPDDIPGFPSPVETMTESAGADSDTPSGTRIKLRPTDDTATESTRDGGGFVIGGQGIELAPTESADGDPVADDALDRFSFESAASTQQTATLHMEGLKIPVEAAYLHVHVNFEGEVDTLTRPSSRTKSSYASSRVLVPFSDNPVDNPAVPLDIDLTDFVVGRDLVVSEITLLVIPFTRAGEPLGTGIAVDDFELRVE